MGVEVAVHRGFTGLAVEIAPFPGAVADEAVAGKIRGGLEGLLVCRSGVQAQRLIGSLTVSCAQDLRKILRRCFQELRGWQSAERRKRGHPNTGGEHHSVLFCFGERYGGERPYQGAARPDSSGDEMLGEW